MHEMTITKEEQLLSSRKSLFPGSPTERKQLVSAGQTLGFPGAIKPYFSPVYSQTLQKYHRGENTHRLAYCHSPSVSQWAAVLLQTRVLTSRGVSGEAPPCLDGECLDCGGIDFGGNAARLSLQIHSQQQHKCLHQ